MEEAYGLAQASLRPIEGGLINRTFEVRLETGRRVLQRLHPVFGPEVNVDIDVVSRHLQTRGVLVPRVVRAITGALWVEAEGAVWRMLTYIEGITYHRVRSPALAGEGAVLAAAFHHALCDFEHRFHFARPGAHDTPAHLARLESTVAAHPAHRLHPEVERIAEAIGAHARELTDLSALPRRVVHGDLKISNILFDAAGRARALVDLDTIGYERLAVEMGDALRSWCNPAGEDATEVRVDEGVFEAAVTSYAGGARAFIQPDEVSSLVSGFETIALELAARFAADALAESYFGWDPSRYPSRGAHNLARAGNQLALAQAVRARRSALEAMVRRAFRGAA